MFMVGSFAEGLSGGLEKGFKFAAGVQDRWREDERYNAVKAEQAKKQGGGGLPPLIDVRAKAPSPLEADPTGTGTSAGAGEAFDPEHPDAKKAPTIKDGQVVTPAQPALLPPSTTPSEAATRYPGAAATGPGLFPPEASTRTPAAQQALPSMAPDDYVASEPPSPPSPQSPSWDPARAIAPYVPQQGLGAAAGAALRRALPAAQSWIGARTGEATLPGWQTPWFARPSQRPAPPPSFGPPSALGTFGGTLIGPAGAPAPPASPNSPVFTAPIPPPIDPRTGRPYEQAVPFTLAPY